LNVYEVERLIVSQKSWNAEIDHIKGTVKFHQNLESAPLKDQLVTFGKKLSCAYNMIKQKDEKLQMEKIGKAIEEERDLMIKRRLFIEKKKKWEEEQEKNKEKLKQDKAQILAQQRIKEDEDRVKKDIEKREESRKKLDEEKQKEQEAIKELRKLLDIENQNISNKKKKKQIDISELSAKQVEDLIKTKKRRNRKRPTN